MGSLYVLVMAAIGAAVRLFRRLSGTPEVTSPAPQWTPLANVILIYNNSRPFFILGPTYANAAKGVLIHKITPVQAQVLASVIDAAATKCGLWIPYVLACLAIESCLDPNCVNGNLGPGRSNPTNDPLGYDVGVAQEKERYLLGYHGVLTAADARAFALDINDAIPYFCALMVGKIAAAQTIIAATPLTVKPDPRMKNPLMLGTWMYNEGDTGAITAYNAGQFPNHCASVLGDEEYFAGKLGVPSIFAQLPS